MSTVTALLSGGSFYDAYGVTLTPPYGAGENLNIPGTPPFDGKHLKIALKAGRRTWSIHEITFDDATDLLGPDLVPGHTATIGLWLSAWVEGDEVAHSGDDSLDFDPLSYPVPDLRPADNGHLGRRPS
jgi:hypothetical protein